MFGGSVQCSRKWVGTTEAAALLRYFGCRAQLVEFLGEQMFSTLGDHIYVCFGWGSQGLLDSLEAKHSLRSF
jgi:hypothetical protein